MRLAGSDVTRETSATGAGEASEALGTEKQRAGSSARSEGRNIPTLAADSGNFGDAKVRYRGLAKNTQRLMLLLGLTNLITAERYLAA